MKKYLMILFIMLVFSSLAFAQTDPQFVKVGMANTSGGGGDGSITAGATVYVEAVGNGSGGTLVGSIHDNGTSTNNSLYIYYYSDSPPATYQAYKQVTGTSFAVNSNTLNYQFDMPTEDGTTSGAASIEIYFGLVGQVSAPPPPTTNYGTAELSYSSVNDAPTNYDVYLTYGSDTTTLPPTLDLPASNSIIDDSFTVQYDQPETARASTVRLSFTRTGGSGDQESPHTCTLESEAAGTDITLTLDATDLVNSTGVESVSGGNSLVVNAIYTVKIEYMDLAQNAAANDQNTGITYDNGDIINISGGDYNAGTSFSPGTDNNAFFRIQMSKTGSGVDPTVTAIEFDLLGSLQSSDLSAIKLWRSSNNSFESGTDTQIAIDNTSPFDPFTASIDEDIGSTATYYFLTVDVTSSASGIDAIGAEITASSDITATTSVSGNFPITGSTHPLPVTLSSFSVNLSGQPVLYWTTQSETNNAYWNIYRGVSQNMGQAIQINYGDMILGQGTVTEPTDYTYVDNYPILESTTYYYWLECVDNAGEADILGPVSLFVPEGIENNGTPATPDDYGLKQNFPNPFNPDTEINFALAETSPVRLTIYNLKGEKIKTIFEGFVEADMVQSAYWDGTDKNGKTVATGVYLYRLKTNRSEYSRRMLLMK